jgi:osmoprotectant transport system ATP-binding protein
MSGAAVSLRRVSVRYGGGEPVAVEDVDLEIAPGELLVLLGGSGAGKSTLLRCINRLVVPTAGTVLIDGRDIAELPPAELRRGIGYVIQAIGLFPHLTIAENVAIVPQLLGWPRERIAARVDELLGMVRLDLSYRDRLPRRLSGGEQQRAGVARALAAEPRVLLMDEPFGAVDAIVRAELQDELLRIHRELQTTIVFVTHDVDEALRIADRIAVIHRGRLEQVDAPLHLLAHPRTDYVAALVHASDVLRRLGLMRAREAATTQPTGAVKESAPRIAADATLRDALGRLLIEGEPLAVTENGRALGVLTFEAIAGALRA